MKLETTLEQDKYGSWKKQVFTQLQEIEKKIYKDAIFDGFGGPEDYGNDRGE